jgi:hypothetical protein
MLVFDVARKCVSGSKVSLLGEGRRLELPFIVPDWAILDLIGTRSNCGGAARLTTGTACRVVLEC